MPASYQAYSREVVLRKAYLGLNLLSFCFNWDNYALLPVLYPRVTSPHFANSTPEMYGWVGASFSIAAVFGSLLFGAWADKRGAREPLFVAQFVMIIGDVLTYFRFNAVWNILGGRIVSGFASGSRTCCLWYLAKTTTGAERGQMIGNFYAAGMLGMIFAPAMAALAAVFPTPETANSILDVNAYNAPVLSTLLIHFVAVLIVYRYVHDPLKDDASAPLRDAAFGGSGAGAVADEEDLTREQRRSNLDLLLDPNTTATHYNNSSGNSSGVSSSSSSSAPGPPCGAYILVALQYLMLTGISSFETFVVPLFTIRFHAGKWVPGAVLAGIGFVVLVSAITGGILNSKCKWSERCIEMTGLIIFTFGCGLSYDWSSIIKSISNEGNILLELLSTVFVSIGFTWAFTTQPSLFSKLIMNHENGVLIPKMGYYMSWLSMAGSAAKISGPLVVGYGLVAGTALDSINLLVSVVVGLAVLSFFLFLFGWTNLYVPEGENDGNVRRTTSVNSNHNWVDDANNDLTDRFQRKSSLSRLRGSSSYTS